MHGQLAHAVMSQVRRGQKVIVSSFVSSRAEEVPGSRSTLDGAVQAPQRTYTYTLNARLVTLVTQPPRAGSMYGGEGEQAQHQQ